MLTEKTITVAVIMAVLVFGSVYAMGFFRGTMRNGLIVGLTGGLIFYLVEAFNYIRFYW